jgi:hypothetical protein
MPISFNALLTDAGLNLSDVRLLRHKDKRAARGRSPYELWRDNRSQFDLYQSHQRIDSRERFNAKYWASFVATLNDETMFVGLYSAMYRGLLEQDTPMPHMNDLDKAQSCDVYDLTMQDTLSDLVGRLFIDWGAAERAWVQRADRQNKLVIELRRQFKEPDFPGFLAFAEPLSKLQKLPMSWVTALKSSKGIYLLTCPKTKEQYVGSATGAEGFWQRWQDYVHTGDGGNMGLKSRDPSDYQVSILEVAGSAFTLDDILKAEVRWKSKLQSREMGLNRN